MTALYWDKGNIEQFDGVACAGFESISIILLTCNSLLLSLLLLLLLLLLFYHYFIVIIIIIIIIMSFLGKYKYKLTQLEVKNNN